MPHVHPKIEAVTQRIQARHPERRQRYLKRVEQHQNAPKGRQQLSCANLAHAYAASQGDERQCLLHAKGPNLAIVSAYNDMLSAHQPYADYPAQIKAEAQRRGATAQVAGGVPAMCDGVTQGQAGMDLSLMSRDVIALSTAIALSHNVYDAGVYLGVCDKIVPGLLMGALSFGHLPALFIPSGPMSTGSTNAEKAAVRQAYAAGKASRDELLASELRAYHEPGTCTFYGTANSNQVMLEFLGLQLPGSSFVHPDANIRPHLTRAATQRAVAMAQGERPALASLFDERSVVNAIIGLLASGGSTNHTLHLVAIARCAGITLTWDDFNDLSKVIPLLAAVYPNGPADINQFHAAGGIARLIHTLIDAELLHEDVPTVAGMGLSHYCAEPFLQQDELIWRRNPAAWPDSDIIANFDAPIRAEGGLKVLDGNLGRAVIKVSAVKPEHQSLTAPARVFDDPEALKTAFQAGELTEDFIAVVRHQGPRANGMPELHTLIPYLGVLQDRGLRVALVTDGRLSGASGKVPAALHLCPESAAGGPIGRLRDGDVIHLDAKTGKLEVQVSDEVWATREPTPASQLMEGMGRELFGQLRRGASDAETGALCLDLH